MKKILSAFAALALALSMLGSMFVFADGEVQKASDELVVSSGKVTVDGKKDSSEWGGAASITVNSSNSTLTLIQPDAVPYEGDEVTISFKYDNEFLYILEERKTDYLYTVFNEGMKHQVYRGDSTDIFLSLYLPDATDVREQQYSTCDILISADSNDGDPDDTDPLFLYRTSSLYSTAWGIPSDKTGFKIESVVNSTRQSSVTEVAVAWDTLFQGNSMNNSKFVEYKKYIPQFVAAGGLAVKFAAVVHEGNSGADHCYSYAYGANIKVDAADTFNGTNLVGDDIPSWPTLYIGSKNSSANGQIDLASIVDEAKQNEEDEEGKENLKKILLYVGIGLVIVIIAVIIVFRIFGIQIGIGSSDDDEDEEDDDEEYDEDEEDEEEEE